MSHDSLAAPRENDSPLEIWTFRLFQIGLIAKLIVGIFETAGAVLLTFIPAHDLVRTVDALIRHIPLTHSAAVSRWLNEGLLQPNHAHLYAVLYLLIHGVAKIVLVLLVWRGRLWAYPALIVVFGLFVGYQVYRILIAISLGMVLLTVVDIVLIVLTWHEWRRAKRRALLGGR